jgi:hypothetical protein
VPWGRGEVGAIDGVVHAVGDIEVVAGLEVLGSCKGNHVTVGDVGFVQILVGFALLYGS